MDYCICFIGVMRKAIVEFCKCFSESELLISLGYFPSTPVNPKLAIDVQLFDFLEAMLLECHVSVYDFVAALRCMSDVLYKYQVHIVYAIIIIFPY